MPARLANSEIVPRDLRGITILTMVPNRQSVQRFDGLSHGVRLLRYAHLVIDVPMSQTLMHRNAAQGVVARDERILKMVSYALVR